VDCVARTSAQREATDRASKLEARVRVLTEELDARTGYRRVVGECSCGGCLVPTWLKLVRPAACNDHRRVFAPVHLGT